jgi:hypothetical protein
MTARRISGSMNGGDGLRISFVGFVTVHTHMEPAGITSLRTMEKASPSIDVCATRRCWPGLTLKSMLTSAEGTLALVTPSREKIIGQREALITLTVVSCDGCGAHCAFTTTACTPSQRHTTNQSRVILIKLLMLYLPAHGGSHFTPQAGQRR